MPIIVVPENKRLWQVVAEEYRPAHSAWAKYAPNARIGAFHAGTLAINFEPYVNPISLHNPWSLDLWPNGYHLRIPDEWAFEDFPNGFTPEEVAEWLGYSLEIGADNPIIDRLPIPQGIWEDPDMPYWVKAYVEWLRQQIARYGEVRVRQTEPEHV